MAGKKPQVLSTVVSIGGAISPSLGRALGQAQGMITQNLGKAGIAGALGAVAAGAKKLADDYGKAFRTIRVGTGATGKALDTLMADVNATLKGSASDIGDVAKAVADYNTAFGATGKELQDISRAALIVSDRFGEDLGGIIQSSSKAMKAWGVDVRDGAKTLNYFRKVSQNTGIGVTALQEATARYAPQLKGLGYSLESSAALLGTLNKEGIRGEQMMSALNKITSAGADGWAGYYEAIHDAKSEQEALSIASELFGKETAPAMTKAIRSGALEIGAMTEALSGDKETLDAFAKDTETLGDIVKEIGNSLEALLLPAVKAVMENLRDALKWWQSSNGKAFIEGVKSLFNGKFADRFISDDVEATGFKGLPQKASGGWVGRPALCGEAGPEAVISLDPAYRAENLRYWSEAGQALGAGAGGVSVDMSGMVFAPTINGGTSGTDIIGELRSQSREFADAIVSALDARAGRMFV